MGDFDSTLFRKEGTSRHILVRGFNTREYISGKLN